jgi:arsenite methyltransferase
MSLRHFRQIAAVLAAGATLATVGTSRVDADATLQTRTAVGTPPQGETGRESWQRVPDIFAAMGIADGAVVADIGAGSGFFTTRLSKAVGANGRVYAVDVSSSALSGLRLRLERDGITNVETVLGSAADPKLPEGVLDAALIVNAYHEMTEHQAMLAAIGRALKPTGRLVIVEPIVETGRGAPRASQERNHQIAPQYVQADGLAAGYLVARFEDPFTRRGGGMPEYMVVLTPGPAPAPAMPDHAHAGATDDVSRKPDEVVAALSLRPGQTVYDIGAGSGLFTRRLAQAVSPAGRAIGLDIEPAIIEGLKADALKLGLSNYDARLVAADDPAIPPSSADVIFLSNTYHHLENRVAYARRLRAALKPTGRLVIVDFAPGAMGGAPMEGHPDQKQVEAELASAGFRLSKAHTFLDRQFFLEFVPR